MVKEEEKTVENDEVTAVKEEKERESTVRVAVVEIENAPAEEKDGVETSFPDPEVEVPMEEEEDEVRVPNQRRNTQKRRATKRLAVAPPPPKRAMRDVVIRLRRRAEMVPSGDVGAAVCSALNGAIAVEIHPDARGIGPFVRAFLSATAEAGQKLVEVHAQHPVQTERHLEDMRLLLSVAVANLERGLSRDEVCAAWKMLKVLQQLHDLYPAKTKGLHRSCLQLYNCLVKKHAVPSDVVEDFRMKLGKVLEEVDEWSPLDGLTAKWFDQQMSLVNELLEGQFEHWNPRDEPVLGKVVANLERICTFGVGDEWNDRYASICLACSKMSRSTFFWTFDLAEDMTNSLIRCNELEPGFEDRNRVKKDFEYVTSYDEEVRQISDAVKKKEAFDELIDRLRWIFNAVAMTKKQSLLPLAQLKQLNKCLATIVDLCDNGDALNLEGCLHLEKLLAVMRQVMYARIDYAKVSVGATNALLGLFSPDKRARFVYPDGCS
ncbi:hypothetical protein PR003_g5598 [Phytophthora rubi]|uniref:Uncharacterized protein n=1 Tax=Phytophthora rubi TaxID=129364 RepID=A0A6A3NLZ1_9STRA|nr:hypothetical protein PR001_g5319 [Phytophthora rubi]KAE9349979.1 hypothetical protein PR003_g5598 [Phytophthora rubi]